MSNAANKLIQAAAGNAGGDPVYVEDVFSTFVYDGLPNGQGIVNGINLGNFGVGSSTDFDGTSDYLSRSSDFTGNTDSTTLTFSFWVKLGVEDIQPRVYSVGNTRISMDPGSASEGSNVSFAISNGGSGASDMFTIRTTDRTLLPPNQWNHIVTSINKATNEKKIAINDTVVSFTQDYSNSDAASFAESTHTIMAQNNGTVEGKGRFAHIFLDYTYRDLSTESNRRLFIDANGGSTSPSTLSALNPIMYVPMTDAYAVGKNLGTGGDLTANGSPTIVEDGTEYVADSGKGGLVWIKGRTAVEATQDHRLIDTERGVNEAISSALNDNVLNITGEFTRFNSDGFSLADTTTNGLNRDSEEYVSWTFRNQPGFFEVIKYEGNGTAGRTVSHNLGSAPGCIIVKRVESGQSNGDFFVFHRGNTADPETERLILNGRGATSDTASAWNDTAPTATEFTLGSSSDVNASSNTYIAYLFAHDDQSFGEDSDEAIIKCGSYTGTGAAGNNITVGFEPQWIMFKRTDAGSSDWVIFDAIRGLTATSSNNGDRLIYPNQTNAEGELDQIALTATGFVTEGSWGEVNASSGEYIYVAIRRPNKPASELAATDLFDPIVGQTSGKPNYPSSTGVVDAMFRFNKAGDVGFPQIHNRLTPPNYLISHNNAVESTTPSATSKFHFVMNDGWGDNIGGTSTNPVGYMFRRAKGFFDVVTYAGTGSFVWINHNLGVVPEMVWFKGRDYASHWSVFTTQGGTSSHLRLNDHDGNRTTGQSSLWTNLPTATQFRVGSDNEINGSGYDYVAYFFASVDGISKIGTYSGTASNIDVDCGFSSGARFILIKQVNTSGNWYVWDAANGIVAGNDPFMQFNTSGAQTTGMDLVDPLSSGFTVVADSSTYPLINTNGATYLFYAIA